MMGSTAESFMHINEIRTHLSSSDNEQLVKPDSLLLRQRLQSLCRSVLLNNLETALDQKIETDLWNFAFKAQITALQQQTRSKSSSKKAEVQADLNLFLEAALGFYMQLLEDICEAFHLHPVFRRKYSSFGIIQGRSEVSRRSQLRFPKKRSSMYICQYCLVHLGDIARYLQRISFAENFYNLASQYVPSNGQPYNQLAILCSTRSNKLAVTYYYIRSIAVRSPFPVAPTNLEKLYTKQLKDCENTNFISKNKWTHSEVISVFLYLQALIHLESDKEKATKLGELLYRCLCSQTIFSLLTVTNMRHMVAISLFTLSHLDETGGDKSITEEEQHFRDVTVSFVSGFLEVLLNQAPKYNVREHITLPAIKIILDWLVSRQGYLANPIIKTHRCWLSLSKALNAIQTHCKDPKSLDLSHYDSYPLPEDVELQCFLPLTEAHDQLDFSLAQTMSVSSADITRLRCNRLVLLGKQFAEKYPSLNLIDYKVNAKNTKIIFSAATSMKVEPSSRKTSIKNVAIQQALKSHELNSGSETSTDPGKSSDWPMPVQAPSKMGGAYGLPPAQENSAFNTNPPIEHVASLGSFQSDITPPNRTAVNTPPTLQQLFNLGSADNTEILPRRNSQGAMTGPAMMSQQQPRSHTQQGVIGSGKTTADIVHSTSMADNLKQPINFSASDSALVFASHAANSYSLFSPTFDMQSASSGQDLTGSAVAMRSDSPASSFITQSTHMLASSSGWPSSSSQSNTHSGLESSWGNKSALAQLLEEQQKRHQQATRPDSGANS